MKAAVLHGPNDLRIDEIPRPAVKDREALVRIKACGLCTLEQRLYAGKQKIFYPLVAGHEASGIVEEIDDRALTSLRPGNRVTLDLLNRCGECYYCRIGSDHLCENRFKKGLNLMGGFGEYVAVPTSQLHGISEDVSFAEAALTEPLATCIHSVRAARPSLEETMLIFGVGVMGVLHVMLASVLGFRTIVCDLDEARLEKAAAFGADAVLNPSAESDMKAAVRSLTEGRGADVVVLATPAEAAFQQAIQAVRPGGRIVLFAASGNHDAKTPVSTDHLHGKEISLVGVQGRTSAEFQQAVSLLNRRTIDLRPLVSETVPLERIAEGMERASDPSTYRVVVEMDSL